VLAIRAVGATAFFVLCASTRERCLRAEELATLFAPVAAALGLECLGVEYSPSRGNARVRVYIDAPGRPVTIEDCEAVSRELAALLDVEDPIQGRYDLEVSSPGFDRPLFNAAQFGRFAGQPVRVQVSLPVAGRRRFQGPILRVDADTLVIGQDGSEVAIALSNVHKANLVPDFSAYAAEKPGKAGRKSAAGGKRKKA
jgi:ribosome maturation factor RimP